MKSSIQGALPAYQQTNEFCCGECGAFNVVKTTAIEFGVSSFLKSRRLYCWLWADVTDSSNFFVIGSINFKANNTLVGKMPVAVASGSNGNSPLTASIASVCISGGQSVADCLGLYVFKPTGSQPTNVILQPLYLTGEMDTVSLSIDQVGPNVSNIRAWLAVLSGQN